jgi:hypothetical protein
MNTDALVKNKTAVIGIVVLLLAFLAYSIFKSPAPTDPLADKPVSEEALVQTAEELSGITFRQDLFATPAYKALVDWSVTLPEEQGGRKNPFNPIGKD